MSKKFLILLPLFYVACSKANFSSGSDPVASRMGKGKEIVEVNGVTIGEGYLEMLSDINPRVKSQIKNPMARGQLVKNLVEQELMYQESVKRGLDKEKEVAEKAALYKRVVIAQALLDDELAKKSKEYYEKNKDAEFTKVQVSGIQIDFKPPTNGKPPKPSDATAEEKQAVLKKAEGIHARLQKGEDFAVVAEEVSDDKISKKKGGDLGLISKTEKRLERRGLLKIADTAFQTKKDEISKPFETKDAYYIIKVTSDPQPTPFEEVDNLIRFQIRQDIKNELIGELTKKGKIKYADSPSPAPPPPPPTPPDQAGQQPPPPPPATGPVPEGTPPPPPPPSAEPEGPPSEQPKPGMEDKKL